MNEDILRSKGRTDKLQGMTWDYNYYFPTLYTEAHLNSKEIHLKTKGDTFKY